MTAHEKYLKEKRDNNKDQIRYLIIYAHLIWRNYELVYPERIDAHKRLQLI